MVIKTLQRELATVGDNPGPIDGVFGSKTKAALEKFQRHAKLKVIGKDDAKTDAALKKAAGSAHTDLFEKAAKSAATRLGTLSTKVKAATADGHVSTAERADLNARIASQQKVAEGMTKAEATPVLAALTHVQGLLKNGSLKAESASTLDAAAAKTVAAAKAFAKKSAFGPSWTERQPGIATRDFTYQGLQVHAVAVDLADPRVKIASTSEAARGKTVAQFGQAAAADVAMNGDFFSFGSYVPSGFEMNGGKPWAGSKPSFEGYLAFNGSHAQVMGPDAKAPAWATNAVSSRPSVLRDGKIIDTDPNKNERSGRTGTGLSKDGRTLYLVAVQGQSGVSGLTGEGLGVLMRDLGAFDGIAMDSGGSAQLYEKGRGLVQRSTDPGGQRVVANALLIESK